MKQLNKQKNQKIVQTLRNDPEVFVNVIWGGEIKLWQKQIEILESIVKNQRTIVPAGFNVGKTFVASIAILQFLYTRPSIVLTTAPTWRQVESILWSEITALHYQAKMKLPGDLLKTKLTIREDKRWFAMGLSTDKPEKFQGYHEENILIVIDEGPGVPKPIWEATEGIMGSRGARILTLGNPVSLYDPFGQASLSSLWHCIPISCYDHPNVVQDKIIYPKMVTKQWCEERKQEWGVDSYLYISRVLGQFPTSEVDTVIPIVWVERAIRSKDYQFKNVGPREGAIDVAAGGADRTVIGGRQGLEVFDDIRIYRGKDNEDTMKTVGRCILYIRQYGLEKFKVDQTGVGKGVADRLREREKELNCKIIPLDFGGGATDPLMFKNIAAEMWWGLGELHRQDLISLPNNIEMKKDLVTRKWVTKSYGPMKLESKEDMKGRQLNSPDIGDMIAMLFYNPPERKFHMEWV